MMQSNPPKNPIKSKTEIIFFFQISFSFNLNIACNSSKNSTCGCSMTYTKLAAL